MNNKSNKKARPNLSPHNEFYTLSACAWDAIHDIRAGDEHFEYFLKWAMEWRRTMAFTVFRNVNCVELDMTPHKQINFPCEAEEITKVGWRVGDMIRSMTMDRNIPRIFDRDGCTPLPNNPLDPCPNDGLWYPFYGYNSQSGLVMPKYYGLGVYHNGVGYFDIDEEQRFINFKEVVSNINKVYIEFVTDGLDYEGTNVIPKNAYLACKKYIHWQRKEYDERFGLGERQEAKSQYENEIDEYIVNEMDLSLPDIKEALWAGMTQVPRV